MSNNGKQNINEELHKTHNVSACVFDLDLTLGDFGSISYFGDVYAPESLILSYNLSNDDTQAYMKILDNYTPNIKDLLNTLRDSFENELYMEGIQDKILRPNLYNILSPLVKNYKNGNINIFAIYSNNSGQYNLEYAGRRISKMFGIPQLFSEYISRNDPRRIYDGPPSGYRKKTRATLEHILTGLDEEKLLFMDDNPHEDLLNKKLIYIDVEPCFSIIEYKDIEIIWSLFETAFKECLERYKVTEEEFFNLHHITLYLQAKNLEDMKNKYISYTKPLLSKTKQLFIEDESITKEIDSYIKKVSRQEGGRRKRIHQTQRRLRRLRKSIKRRK